MTASLMRISRHAGKYRLTTGLTVSCPAQAACTVTATAVVALSGGVLGRTRTNIPAAGRRSIAFNLTPRTARRLQLQARHNKSIAIYGDLLARTGSGPALAIKRLGISTGWHVVFRFRLSTACSGATLGGVQVLMSADGGVGLVAAPGGPVAL